MVFVAAHESGHGPKVKKLGTLRWSADRIQTGRMSPASRRLAAGCQLPDLDHDLPDVRLSPFDPNQKWQHAAGKQS